MSQGGTLDAVVRLQALDGTWETCGADRAIKVNPASLAYSHNEWGADKATFDLHRSVIALWPDIGAYTPVEIEVGGVVVWDGRTGETPIKGGSQPVINVQCKGWQYHLDDDVYQRAYVHAKLTDWKDARSFLGEDLTKFTTAGTVTSQQGVITIGWPNGTVLPAEAQVAVKLDLGPSSSAAAIGIEVKGITGAANSGGNLTVQGQSTDKADGSNQPLAGISLATIGTTTDVYEGNFPTPSKARYVTVGLYVPAGVTLNGDVTVQIRAATVVTQTSYITAASTTSTLTASRAIIQDAVERATMLLSSDFSQIAATTFAIPDFTLSKASTPREAIEAANAYHNWIAKILTGKRLSYQPRPTAPMLEVGLWPGAQLEDTSANNGAEIYNRALVEGTGADGSPLVVERTAGQQPGVLFVAPESPSPGNASFTTSTATWVASGTGAITRNTEAAHYHSAPAAGGWSASAGETLTETFSGTFRKGTAYRLVLWVQATAVSGASAPVTFSLGVAGDGTSLALILGPVYQKVELAWIPTQDHAGVTLVLAAEASSYWVKGGIVYVDDLSLTVAEPTLVDRRGFRRTKVIQPSMTISIVEGKQLADIFLQSHMTTPFKGSAAISPGGVRRVLGGQQMHPSQLGLHTQELLRLAHLVDPDTGGMGRDGTIAEVSYTHKDQKAAATLDDKRGNFDALLARLAVVQSVGS